MSKEYPMQEVQLLFPAAAIDKDVWSYLKPNLSSIVQPATGRKAGHISSVPVDAPMENISLINMTEISDNVLGIDFQKLLKVFKGLKIEQIELWINGAAETQGLLKLALSAKGEGGIKIVLKPDVQETK